MGRSRVKFLWLIILVFGQMSAAAAQKSLTKPQLEALIRRLTENPRETWLSKGSLKAVRTHHQAPAVLNEDEILAIIEEKIEDYKSNPTKPQKDPLLQAKYLQAIPFNVRYDYQNASTTVTTEYIRVDEDKFYRETCIDFHEDSITPTRRQAENNFVHQMNLKTNKRKVYSYDGKRDARYIKSAGFALVEDSLGAPKKPKALRAGLIPWGTDIFTQEAILNSSPSASVQRINGERLIHLEFHHETASVTATLDPRKSLATLDCTITRSDGAMVSFFDLSRYVRVDGQWIPTSIFVEQYVPENDQLRPLRSDQWQLEIVHSPEPGPRDFSPDYEDGTLVNYTSPKCTRPLKYRHRKNADTEELLEQRLFTLGDCRPQNCASVAIEYIARKFKKPLTVPPSTIIDYAGASTLYDMEQYLNSQGLFAKAIKTSVDRLPSYEDCYTLIYLPHISHYLLIDRVDEHNIWVIDLTSNNFYMAYAKDTFQKEWADGIALLVSNRQILTPEETISDFERMTISGSQGYQCTFLVQESDELLCTVTPGGTCIGYKEVYYAYYQCAAAPFGECYNNLIVLDHIRLYCRGSALVPNKCELEQEIYFFLDWACHGTLPPRA